VGDWNESRRGSKGDGAGQGASTRLRRTLEADSWLNRRIPRSTLPSSADAAFRDRNRASAARFDPRTGKTVVDLTNGCTFVFPARLVEGLEGADDEDLATVEVLPQGRGLHWEGPDMDISIPGLVNGIFGTRAHMARIAGSSRSPAKTAASRANGAKGGRPRKTAG
jgi:hypothetical protein